MLGQNSWLCMMVELLTFIQYPFRLREISEISRLFGTAWSLVERYTCIRDSWSILMPTEII